MRAGLISMTFPQAVILVALIAVVAWLAWCVVRYYRGQ